MVSKPLKTRRSKSSPRSQFQRRDGGPLLGIAYHKSPVVPYPVYRVIGYVLADLFNLFHHLRVGHSSLPPGDEAKAQESVHTAPNDFWGDLVPRMPRSGVSSGVCACAV